jgi:CheY-like chemotaxis protein
MGWEKYKEISLVIVDNDSFTRELLTTIFKQKTLLNVYSFSNTDDALDFLKKSKVELILLDFSMLEFPVLEDDGQDFLEIIKLDEGGERPLIILMTIERLTKKRIKELGIDYSISKLFDFGNIVSEMYAYLEEKVH